MHTANEQWKLDCAEYADDIIFLSDNKDDLRRSFVDNIKPYIEQGLEMQIKSNWQIFPIADNRQDKHGRALDYVGYKFFRRQKLIRKSIKQNLCRAVARLKGCALPKKEFKQRVAPWLGWAKHSNSKQLIKTIIPSSYASIL